jgi:hypothetical protein
MSQSSEGDVLEWSVWPWKESTRRTVIVVAVITAVGVAAWFLFQAVFWGIFAIAILFASLHTYFSRTTYRLDDQQVIVRSSVGTVAKKWAVFKRYYVDKKGVTLSPFARPSRLEPFRSTRLLYGGNRDAVVAFVSARIDRDAASRTG